MNKLVSDAEKLLIQSTRFDEDANQHYIDKHKDEIPHVLYGMLSHLSEPSDPRSLDPSSYIVLRDAGFDDHVAKDYRGDLENRKKY